jgi:hypothetical protein
MKRALCLLFMMIFAASSLGADEILEETHTKVTVRNHPRTGIPFVSISPEDAASDPFADSKPVKRPDYRMLDPKIKPKDVGYEGPVSDRKKVYILAASLATVGTVGGAGIIAAAPAATGTGAASGAGLYGAAGTAVVAGTAAGTVHLTKPSEPERVNFSHVSEAHAVPEDKSQLA